MAHKRSKPGQVATLNSGPILYWKGHMTEIQELENHHNLQFN
jgi:hypothetical protein